MSKYNAHQKISKKFQVNQNKKNTKTFIKEVKVKISGMQ